jgi:CopG family nickel-responsive transcriptional regulator
MAHLVRTGLSLDRKLLLRFDRAIAKKGYNNRSEAVRDLIRGHLVSEEVHENRIVVGTLTMVYDHHRPALSERLIALQHHSHGNVLATTHVHLDRSNCLEVVLMKGRSAEVKGIADEILSLRGVKHGRLVLTSTGKGLAY